MGDFDPTSPVAPAYTCRSDGELTESCIARRFLQHHRHCRLTLCGYFINLLQSYGTFLNNKTVCNVLTLASTTCLACLLLSRQKARVKGHLLTRLCERTLSEARNQTRINSYSLHPSGQPCTHSLSLSLSLSEMNHDKAETKAT